MQTREKLYIGFPARFVDGNSVFHIRFNFLAGQVMPSGFAEIACRFIGLQIKFVLSAAVLFWIICYVCFPNISNMHEAHLSLSYVFSLNYCFICFLIPSSSRKSEKHGRVFSTDIFSLSDHGSSVTILHYLLIFKCLCFRFCPIQMTGN